MRTMLLLIATTVAFGGTVGAINFPIAYRVPCDFCSEYEVLQSTPPCCEATCETDCSRAICPKVLVYAPTCVCLHGYVRNNGQCIPKCQCPKAEPPHPPPAPLSTPTTPAVTVPGTTETKPREPTTSPRPTTHTIISTPLPSTTTPPSCATTQVPCTKKPLPKYIPKHFGYTVPPAKCASNIVPPPPPPPSYRTIPPYRYTSPPTSSKATPPPASSTTTTPKPRQTTPKPSPTTTTTVRPPTTTPSAPCAACEQLVLTRPCCEPTCDYDCSNSPCPPVLLLEEATCACRPGLVRYQGHCIEPSACPKAVSRYRVFVPLETQCLLCNGDVLNTV